MPSPRQLRQAGSGLALALALLSCSSLRDMREVLAGLQKLQQGLVARFQEPNTTINITNSNLVVTFVNSPIARLPEAQRATTARRVAEYVRDHYPGYPQLTRVSVAFQTKASIGIASTSRTEVPYSYSPSDLGPAPVEPAAAARDSVPQPAS